MDTDGTNIRKELSYYYLRCVKDRDQPLSNNIFSTQLAFFLSIRAYQRIGTNILLMYIYYTSKALTNWPRPQLIKGVWPDLHVC